MATDKEIWYKKRLVILEELSKSAQSTSELKTAATTTLKTLHGHIRIEQIRHIGHLSAYKKQVSGLELNKKLGEFFATLSQSIKKVIENKDITEPSAFFEFYTDTKLLEILRSLDESVVKMRNYIITQPEFTFPNSEITTETSYTHGKKIGQNLCNLCAECYMYDLRNILFEYYMVNVQNKSPHAIYTNTKTIEVLISIRKHYEHIIMYLMYPCRIKLLNQIKVKLNNISQGIGTSPIYQIGNDKSTYKYLRDAIHDVYMKIDPDGSISIDQDVARLKSISIKITSSLFEFVANDRLFLATLVICINVIKSDTDLLNSVQQPGPCQMATLKCFNKYDYKIDWPSMSDPHTPSVDVTETEIQRFNGNESWKQYYINSFLDNIKNKKSKKVK